MAAKQLMTMSATIDRLDTLSKAVSSLADAFPMLVVQAVQLHAGKSVVWIDPPEENHPLRKDGTLQSRTELGETEIEEIYAFSVGAGVYVNFIDRKRRLVHVRRRTRR